MYVNHKNKQALVICSILYLLLIILIPASAADKPVSFDIKAERIAEETIVNTPVSSPAFAVYVEDKAIRIDGDLSDWPKEIQPLKASGTFDPKDLSAQAFVAVSTTSFYIAVEVNDEKHYQPDYGDRMWMYDSVQFAIDPLFQRTIGRYGSYDHEIGMCFVDGAPLVWRWQRPPGFKGEKMDNARLSVKFSEGRTVYEARIPLEDLWPLRSELGKPIGFSYLVNDSEGGHSRDGFVSWSSGIGSGKDSSAFGILDFPSKELSENVDVAARCRMPEQPTSAEKPQEWTLDVYAKHPGTLRLQCEGKSEHGPMKGSVISGETSFRVPAGYSRWRLLADIGKFAPARIKIRPIVSLDGKADRVKSPEFTIFVYKPGQ